MKRFASQFLITNSGPVLKRAVITTEDDGRVISIDNTGGALKEKHSMEYHNGIIIPGFVNCHCHLELSNMKGAIAMGEGLGSFIEQIRTGRHSVGSASAIYSADNDMYKRGISLCADICNTPETFNLKQKSRIKYINLIEVFGIDPDKASKRMEEALKTSDEASGMNLPSQIVPHAAYSVSLPLFKLLKEKTQANKVTSIHFMETAAEKEFVENHTGQLMTSYEKWGLIPEKFETVKSHSDAIVNEITTSGNLILVHNTFIDRETICRIKIRKNLFLCLCPGSNLYIENKIPPVELLLEEGCEIVLGTDSLASNTKLDVLGELIILQKNYPDLSLEDLIAWATVNGAKALGEQDNYGRIEPGMKPGLLVLNNLDLKNMKLLPGSTVTRLI